MNFNTLSAVPLRLATSFLNHPPISQVRSFSWFRSRFSMQKGQTSIPRKMPPELTVNFSVDKLFQGQQLNQQYVSEKIAESLKKHLPQKIIVQDKSKSRHLPQGQPTVYQQPSTSNSSDFWMYMYLFHSLNSNHDHRSAQYSYHSEIPTRIEEESASHSSSRHDDNDSSSNSSYTPSDNSSYYSSNDSSVAHHQTAEAAAADPIREQRAQRASLSCAHTCTHILNQRDFRALFFTG